jgi:Phage integrase, N-terminal SAM-like domain
VIGGGFSDDFTQTADAGRSAHSQLTRPTPCGTTYVAEFAKHFNRPPDELGSEEIRTWQLHLLNERRVKLSTYIQAVCSLRFLYQKFNSLLLAFLAKQNY